MDANQFYVREHIAFSYICYTIYGLMAIGAVCVLIFSIATGQLKRLIRLTMILLSMIVLSLSWILITYWDTTETLDSTKCSVTLGINYSSDIILHWVICSCYIRVAIDVSSLLDLENFMKNPAAKKELSAKRSSLDVAHRYNMCIAIVLGFFISFGLIIHN